MKNRFEQGRRPTPEEREIFFSSPLFARLDAAERRTVWETALPTVLSYPANDCVTRAGEHFGTLGIVASGRLSVTREGERRRVIHRTLAKGDIFGVSSLFGGEPPFPTTILAETAASVMFLTEEQLEALFLAVPRLARSYIELLTEKIRFLNRRLDSLAGRSAEERVASHLLTHAEGSLGITKSALASLLGLGRASLYRILDRFEERGLITTYRDRIEVRDTEALQMFIKSGKEP